MTTGKTGPRRRLAGAFVLITLALGGCGPSPRDRQQASYPPLAPLPSSYAYRGDRLDQLGRMLFFDTRLSRGNQRACADCHDPARNLSGPGESSWRNAPPLLNIDRLRHFGWDGAGGDPQGFIAEHASDALTLDSEPALVEARLLAIPEYERLFRVAFGGQPPRAQDAWKAIATFLTSLDQPDTPLDAYLKGDRDALGKPAREGLELFSGKAGCIRCHNGALGSDGRFHNLGVPNIELWKAPAEEQIAFRYHQRRQGLSNREASTIRVDQGRWYQTRDARDQGAFRTPTLRGLRHTAPYMHNGAFASLEEVVEFYNRGGQAADGRLSEHRDQRSGMLEPLNLDQEEKQALVALLRAWSASTPLSIPRPTLPNQPRAVERWDEPQDSRQPRSQPRRDETPRSLRERLAPRSYLHIPYSPEPSTPERRQPPIEEPPGEEPTLDDPTTAPPAGSLSPPNRVLSRDRQP